MAKQISLDFLDSLGSSKVDAYEAKLTNVQSTVLKLGVLYAKHLADELNKANAVSSGRGADSLNPDEVVTNGTLTTVNIKGNFYLKFIDKGVNGWGGASKGGLYQFKKGGGGGKCGDFANSPMVKSVKDWLTREKGFGSDLKKKPVTIKEQMRSKLQSVDITTRRAMTVAFMIKRMGIKPTHFVSKATEKVKIDIIKQLGEAFKNDIIANIN